MALKLAALLFLFCSVASSCPPNAPPTRPPVEPATQPPRGNGKPVEAVRGLDLKRYTGRWYEIASFPAPFQPKNGRDVRATYSLNDNGTVNVLNEVWVDGNRQFIQGLASRADPNSDEAKLIVKFPFLPPGNYWVLYIGDYYEVAVVGDPTRMFLWFLAREARISDKVYGALVAKAVEQGYDVSKLVKTPQSETPPL